MDSDGRARENVAGKRCWNLLRRCSLLMCEMDAFLCSGVRARKKSEVRYRSKRVEDKQHTVLVRLLVFMLFRYYHFHRLQKQGRVMWQRKLKGVM